jgi:uncharacterized protein (DUF952 family)
MTILHLALELDWTAALDAGAYRISTRELTLDDIGFIHCSTPAQVADVAARFYADVTAPLRVLEIDVELVKAAGTEVAFEDSGHGELFPHIYGPIDPAWVLEARPARIVNGQLVLG